MMSEVVLCADTESLKDPRLIGLEGENLCAQPWLRVFADACQARHYLRQHQKPHEVWVASSDNVDPINLAAALKRDSSENKVYLLAFQGSGSLKSRVNAAKIDGLLSRAVFAQYYGRRKQVFSPQQSGVMGKAPVQTTDTLPPKDCAVQLASRQRTRLPQSHFGKGLDSEFLRDLDLKRTSGAPSSACQQTVSPGSNAVTETLLSEERPCSIKAAANPPTAVGKQAFVLAVASASGGAGKSTVAALAAAFAQGLGHKTLLIDADLQFGDEQFLLGIEHPLTIDGALRDFARFEKLKPENGLPALLAAPPHLEHSETVSAELPRILAFAKNHFDVIVVNTGAFWVEQHALLLEQATKALFLVDQRPSSLRACNHALELCARCGIATQPFLFAVNRCARGSMFSSIDVSCGLRGAHVVELKEGGREVDELLGAGMPLELIRAENALCVSLESLLVDLLPVSEGGKVDQFFETEKIPGKYNRFSKWKRKVACLC
ncbi:MAG: chromosome partitioning protein ParA [Raoultibacter sp.]